MTDLQDFCQEPRSMAELEDGGFERVKVYAAVKRGDLKNVNATDAWGRKQRGKGLFVSTITPIPYNATLLVHAWSTPHQPRGDIMFKKMEDEIDAEVLRFMPADMTGIRVLGHHDLRQLIRKTLTAGTVLGWAHGELFQRKRMQAKIDQLDYEMKCALERLKEAEMELLAVQK